MADEIKSRSPRAKRLQLVVKMAKEKEQQTLAQWGQCQQDLKQAKLQLEELEQYLHDYQMKLTSQNTGSIASGQIQNVISFINQLKSASEQQNQQIQLLSRHCDFAKQQYLTAHSKVKGLQKLIEKIESQFSAAEEKQLQKLMDEFSARISRNNQR